ncbi:MAG TPA: DUF3667 domain-containing protein [Mucilaginibacter sp.]|jgi:hypothetical protein
MEGQKEKKDRLPAVKHLAHDALHDLIHFDSKFFRTLQPLFFKPGYLAEQALTSDGNNKYVKPFALFVFLNFIFFIFKSRGLFVYSLDTYRDNDGIIAYIAKRQVELHLQLPLLEERFNTAMHFEQKEYLVIMIPLFALVLQLLYGLKRRHFTEHLVFALYFYSFFIVYLMLMPYLIAPLAYFFPKAAIGERALASIILFINWIYLFFATRRVYSGTWFGSFLKSGVLSVTLYLLIAFVYRMALFYIVMHSIGE